MPSKIRREERDPRELKRVLHVGIAYEICMMQRTARERAQVYFPKDAVYRNAFLESFLLHVRNLLEFLAPSDAARRKKDTVLACDYFPSPEIWEGDANRGEAGLRDEFERQFDEQLKKAPAMGCCCTREFQHLLNTKLAHVAYSNRDKTPWPFATIMQGIEGGIELFARAVQDKGKQEIQSLGLDVTAQVRGS